MPAEYHVQNLGCKVNRVESDVIQATLDAAGGIFVTKDEAEVIIINTCTVTGEAEAKTRKAIRQALSARRKPWVIATGCATAIDADNLALLGERLIVLPDRIAAKVKALELLELHEPDVSMLMRSGKDYHTRMGIKIQDGCDNSCSYCIVHIARGPAVSIANESVIHQAQLAEEQGVREIVLTGVNIGAYHKDSTDLQVLLESLLVQNFKLRIRLSSLEPQHATDRLLETIAKSAGRICAHLHLPLQSGCDKTLKEMRRAYSSVFFNERVQQAKALMPQVSLTTDLIVGFPGENVEDFAESLAFCERIGFSRMHVFRYSRRPGTPAATMQAQVPPDEKAGRASQARTLADRMRQADLAARLGKTEEVLIESKGRGTSESYHGVEVPTDYPVGELVPMRFCGYRDNLFLVR